VGGQFLAANLVKVVVARARPDISRLTGFSSWSFPSGHATAAAATFAAFALVAGRGRSRRTRSVLGGLAVGLSAAISATRVLLGVHWLSAVRAGVSLGWAWFALSSLAFGGHLLRFGVAADEAQRVAAQADGAAAQADGAAAQADGATSPR
jgi:undecaprenyl-diphosphatase